MAAPQLRSDHPGLKVIADVTAIFAAGFASEDALAQVVGVLRRGLALRRCRLWRRHPTGDGYIPVTMVGDEPALIGIGIPVAEWIAHGPRWETGTAGALLRLPLLHEGTSLGLLEAIVPEGPLQGVAHDVLVVVAQLLAPVIAGTELSQDLASESLCARAKLKPSATSRRKSSTRSPSGSMSSTGRIGSAPGTTRGKPVLRASRARKRWGRRSST